MSVPEEQHVDQDEGRGNHRADKVIAMDALAATKPVVFVIDIKTIPTLFHLNNQPRQKFKLALRVGHSVPKHQPTGNRTLEPTNRRIRGKCCKLGTTRARTNSAETEAKHQLIPPAKVACPHSVT